MYCNTCKCNTVIGVTHFEKGKQPYRNLECTKCHKSTPKIRVTFDDVLRKARKNAENL